MKINSKQLKSIRNKGHDAITDELGDLIQLWTPQEIKSYVYMVATSYKSLNFDITQNQSELSSGFLNSWKLSYDGLIKFIIDYDDANWFSRNGMGPVRAAQRFSDILNGFRKRYQEELGKHPSQEVVPVKPSIEQQEIFTSIGSIGKWIIGGAVIIGGLYVYNKFASKPVNNPDDYGDC